MRMQPKRSGGIGRLTVRPDGRLIHLSYDPMNAIIGIFWPDGPVEKGGGVHYQIAAVPDGAALHPDHAPSED